MNPRASAVGIPVTWSAKIRTLTIPRRLAPSSQQDLSHCTIARIVGTYVANGILPYYGPFGDIGDPVGARTSSERVPARMRRWVELTPSQIAIADRVSGPTRTMLRGPSTSSRRWVAAPAR